MRFMAGCSADSPCAVQQLCKRDSGVIGGEVMKALTRYCDHGEFGGYHYIDMPAPECGPDDVIVRLKAAAICGADMKHWYADLEGKNTSETLNSIRGHEFAGVIVKVGENVTDWKVGQRVVSDNAGKACGKCPACERGDFML